MQSLLHFVSLIVRRHLEKSYSIILAVHICKERPRQSITNPTNDIWRTWLPTHAHDRNSPLPFLAIRKSKRSSFFFFMTPETGPLFLCQFANQGGLSLFYAPNGICISFHFADQSGFICFFWLFSFWSRLS